MQKKDSSKPSMDKNERKRGRPAGKNRVPLSLSERRARNAQYERERRNETADAMAQLAEAAGCDSQITNPDLLATVISRLQHSQVESLENLKRINVDLEAQIADLENQLESDPCTEETAVDYRGKHRVSQSDSNSDAKPLTTDLERPAKIRKTSKKSMVHVNARPDSCSSCPVESSTDTQDSDWSHHHLGKTLPPQMVLHRLPPSDKKELDCDSAPTFHLQRTRSISSEWSEANSRDEEFNSELSSQSDVFPEKESQQVAKEDFHLLPQISHVNTESMERQKRIMDPFTDREKAILAKLGWGDFINFQNFYGGDQMRWPVDSAGY